MGGRCKVPFSGMARTSPIARTMDHDDIKHAMLSDRLPNESKRTRRGKTGERQRETHEPQLCRSLTSHQFCTHFTHSHSCHCAR